MTATEDMHTHGGAPHFWFNSLTAALWTAHSRQRSQRLTHCGARPLPLVLLLPPVLQLYVKELDDLRTQLSVTRARADASAASAQSAQLQCFELLKQLVEQLENLRKDRLARESSQMQFKDGVLRIEHDIMEVLANAGGNTDCALMKVLDEVETKELESQLEKQQHTDQELKKRVLKLEFCLQARAQTRKLQKMGEQQEKAIKELRDQLATTKQSGVVVAEKQINFWGTYGFKIIFSMSIVILVHDKYICIMLNIDANDINLNLVDVDEVDRDLLDQEELVTILQFLFVTKIVL
ncbi:hypothetical protein RIF29_22787 [Crotalaria pallida]|uniref:Uncharacterized protein n=1 Tax=Crotalaria pallida TaxID=3830 RepID=A0AAN9I739_CROPI